MNIYRYYNILSVFFVIFLWSQLCEAEITNTENITRNVRPGAHLNMIAAGNNNSMGKEGGRLFTGLTSEQNILLLSGNRPIAKEEISDETNYEGSSGNTNYEGMKKDCYYFLGYQFFGVAVLYVSPQSVSGWTAEQKRDFTIKKYYHNVSHIVWDHDKLYINYMLHPYWGMAYYIRARNRGASEAGALGYSVILSSLWEFGVEAMFEEASIQDLIVTPLAGSLLGSYVDSYREGIKSKAVKSEMDTIMLSLTDPMGTLNSWVGDNISKNASVSFSYSLLQPDNTNTLPRWNSTGMEENRSYNLSLSPVYKIRFNYNF